jgi:hypothetical protein
MKITVALLLISVYLIIPVITTEVSMEQNHKLLDTLKNKIKPLAGEGQKTIGTMDKVSNELRNLVSQAKAKGDAFKNMFSAKGLGGLMSGVKGLFGMKLYDEKLAGKMNLSHMANAISDLTNSANKAYEELQQADTQTAKLVEITKKSKGLIDKAI